MCSSLEDYMRAIGLHSGGAIRASLALASNAPDVQRWLDFVGEFIDLASTPDDLRDRLAC